MKVPSFLRPFVEGFASPTRTNFSATPVAPNPAFDALIADMKRAGWSDLDLHQARVNSRLSSDDFLNVSRKAPELLNDYRAARVQGREAGDAWRALRSAEHSGARLSQEDKAEMARQEALMHENVENERRAHASLSKYSTELKRIHAENAAFYSAFHADSLE